MPDELTNQTARSSGASYSGAREAVERPSQLVVITFEDASQADGLYEALLELDKKNVGHLEDAVLVSKDEDGKYQVHEKFHHEKRSGTVKGAVLGTLIGWMLGGPVLGLAGGAIVGRLIGKKMDLGVDQGTIDSVAKELENAHTALFVLGYANHQPSVIEAFKQFNGKIVTTTVEPALQDRLQKALDAENA